MDGASFLQIELAGSRSHNCYNIKSFATTLHPCHILLPPSALLPSSYHIPILPQTPYWDLNSYSHRFLSISPLFSNLHYFSLWLDHEASNMTAKIGANGTHWSNSSTIAPNHLNATFESGDFNEKSGQHGFNAAGPASNSKTPAGDEEEDMDMDALIEDLESQDGHVEEEEEDDAATPGSGRVIPEEQLQTDPDIGLTDAEVIVRRKKYGSNQMKEEKENLFKKFILYFVGPIQFVMEVSHSPISLPKVPCYTRCQRTRLPRHSCISGMQGASMRKRTF